MDHTPLTPCFVSIRRMKAGTQRVLESDFHFSFSRKKRDLWRAYNRPQAVSRYNRNEAFSVNVMCYDNAVGVDTTPHDIGTYIRICRLTVRHFRLERNRSNENITSKQSKSTTPCHSKTIPCRTSSGSIWASSIWLIMPSRAGQSWSTIMVSR